MSSAELCCYLGMLLNGKTACMHPASNRRPVADEEVKLAAEQAAECCEWIVQIGQLTQLQCCTLMLHATYRLHQPSLSVPARHMRHDGLDSLWAELSQIAY